MAYTLSFSIALGLAKAGLTLNAQLVDTAGGDVGSAITTGFVEIGSGNYLLTTSIPDDHRGGLNVYEQGVPAVSLGFAPINPQEAENLDMAISDLADFDPAADDVTVGDILAAALAKFASVDTGETSAVDGSVAQLAGEEAADPLLNTVPGSYPSGSAGYALGRIGRGTISTTSPVAQDGTVTTYQGATYDATYGTALEWEDEEAGWPDLTDADIVVIIDGVGEFEGEIITPTGAGKAIRLELDDDESESIKIGDRHYQAWAEWETPEHKHPLVDGKWISKPRYAA